MISYIIWNGSPEIFSIGTFALRWYGLLFALGFLISQQLLYYIYRKEGKPEKDVDHVLVLPKGAWVYGATATVWKHATGTGESSVSLTHDAPAVFE